LGEKTDYFFTPTLLLHASGYFTFLREAMHRCFVVRLKTQDPRTESLSGRVEHLHSGRVTQFETIDQLVEFFSRCLESEKAEESSRSSENEVE